MEAKNSQGRKAITQLERTAYHEAGHVVAHFVVDVGFRYVTITPSGDALGHVKTYLYGKKFREDIENGSYTLRESNRVGKDIVIYFAGNEADKKFCGRYNHQGSSADFHDLVGLAMRIAGEGKALEAYLKWLRLRAQDLISRADNWLAVQRVAESLLEKKKLTNEEATDVIRAVYKDYWPHLSCRQSDSQDSCSGSNLIQYPATGDTLGC
jgi:hypothetical protein